MHPDGRKRQAAAEALAKVFKENVRLFTLITNTLAKDKEISDRWRGFKDVADSRHLANRVEREVVDALVGGRARGLSAHRAPLLRHEGQVARQGQARLLGPQRAAARQARARGALGRRAGDGARGLRRLRAGHGGHRQALLRRPLDRRAGARGQVARRLLASDGAVGAPLHPHELPGQAARRDDAGARAGPRRAPGAGGAARAAAGADAADAGRDRLRVRRDADLQGADRHGHGRQGSARRCWRRRSRT